MKRKSLFLIFLFLATASFAIEIPNRTIYIEGSAEQSLDQKIYFLDNFRMEAEAKGFTVTNKKEEAGYTFNFHVQNHVDEFNPSITSIILISLINNETGMELISFGWLFSEIDTMYEFNQFLFYNAIVYIPGISDDDLANLIQAAAIDDRWRNKRLYLRASFDYPVVFYALQPDGLIRGQGAYSGTFNNPSDVQHLEHIIIPMPGFTFGVEYQFLNFMSAELNFQVHMGDPRRRFYINTAFGAQLKGIIRTGNFMLQPYGAFSMPLNISSSFRKHPPYSFGAGIQAGIKGGDSGVIFVDLNFMFTPGIVRIRNYFNDLAPNPPSIKYRRFVIGIGAGFKYGFFDR